MPAFVGTWHHSGVALLAVDVGYLDSNRGRTVGGLGMSARHDR